MPFRSRHFLRLMCFVLSRNVPEDEHLEHAYVPLVDQLVFLGDLNLEAYIMYNVWW